LYKVGDRVSAVVFSVWISSFPSILCWRDHLFSSAVFWAPLSKMAVAVWFHFWSSILSHWSLCLFLCQDHAVFIPMAL
jgi:hypothetical protein